MYDSCYELVCGGPAATCREEAGNTFLLTRDLGLRLDIEPWAHLTPLSFSLFPLFFSCSTC